MEYMNVSGFSFWYPLIMSMVKEKHHVSAWVGLLSIAGGTVCYMLLVQLVFV